MSNQTQAAAPAGPKTLHFWMFATTAISTILTLGFWIGGIVFVTRKPIGLPTGAQQSSNESNSTDGKSLSPQQQEDLSEIDRLEMWLNTIDRER